MRKPNLKKMQAECDRFNAAHPVGSDVFVKLDGVDEPFRTKTRSEAQVLSGHTAVIWLEKVSGCYLLDRVHGAASGAADRPNVCGFGLGAEAKGKTMDANKRAALIDQLDRSFQMMPTWAQAATKHALGAPTTNPATGQPFKSFRECISVAADHSLETLRDDFEDNGDLLPTAPTQ